MEGSLYTVDDQAIRAMQRVIFDFVSAAEVRVILDGYMAEPFGDPYNIAATFLNDDIHPYVVISVLNNLRDEGRLPMHPSWS